MSYAVGQKRLHRGIEVAQRVVGEKRRRVRRGRLVFFGVLEHRGLAERADGPLRAGLPQINVARLIRQGQITESRENAIGGAAML